MELQHLASRPFHDISSRDADIDLGVVALPGWGQMWAPETLAEFIRVVQRTTWRTGQPEVWRGQSKGWLLHSGGARRFRDSPIFHAAVKDPATLESFIADYERELVDHARLDGHGEVGGRRRADLEVLGLLQHHGAATRLIDFSLNCLIALWFACREHVDDCGVVIGLDLSQAMQAFRQKAVEAELSFHQGPGMHFWRPWGLSPRMPAQASVLVWSRVEPQSWGSLAYRPSEGAIDLDRGDEREPSELGPGLVAIAVTSDLKNDLIDQWEPVFGYSERWLFPDLDGFARFNAATRAFEPDFYNASQSRYGPAPDAEE
jgi:FRG domain